MECKKEILKELQKCELEIMDVIHNFCVENGIKYSLADGTSLGAYRHKGFIPWDDDIDIMMLREDYEKFIDVWKNSRIEGYILQNYDTNADFGQNFTKIRKDHTCFLQPGEDDKSYHKGIFVDIVPRDRVAPKGVRRQLQYCVSALNLLYSRGFHDGSRGIIGLLERIFLMLPRKAYPKMRCITEKIIKHWNYRNDLPLYSPQTLERSKWYYPSDMFEKRRFCGRYQCLRYEYLFLRIPWKTQYRELLPHRNPLPPL